MDNTDFRAELKVIRGIQEIMKHIEELADLSRHGRPHCVRREANPSGTHVHQPVESYLPDQGYLYKKVWDRYFGNVRNRE